jgi:hypothetical protein
VGGLLADRLVEQNHPAHEFIRALGGDQQLAVPSAVLLGGGDPQRLEAFGDRARALVGGEDALAARDQRSGGR